MSSSSSNARYTSAGNVNDVTPIINDYETFSNAVSVHLNVPNGMDPPERTVPAVYPGSGFAQLPIHVT